MKKRYFLLFFLFFVIVFSQEMVFGECFKPYDPIHVGIQKMGQMFEDGRYHDDVMYSVISDYFEPDGWHSDDLNGYLVWAITRLAIRHRRQIIKYHPNTKYWLEVMLKDYASLDIYNIPDARFAGFNKWNSMSEDYMGFALGFAAADAWNNYQHPLKCGTLESEVKFLVGKAFTIDNEPKFKGTLFRGEDPDPAVDGEHVMMRNHLSYSPVYATLIIKHIKDINLIYQRAYLLPVITEGDPVLQNVQELFNWVAAKIDPDGSGGYIFRRGACEKYNTDDPIDCNDPGYCIREPYHYPMGFLDGLGITVPEGMFGSDCCSDGGQGAHNFYFNCIFPCLSMPLEPEPELEILYRDRYNIPRTLTISDDFNTHYIGFIFYESLGKFTERPGNNCGYPPKNNPYYVQVRVIDNGIPIDGCKVQDPWDGDWVDCPPIAISDWIPNSKLIQHNTDLYQNDPSQPGCPWTSETRYLIGTSGFFYLSLEDDLGNIFVRKVNLTRYTRFY